MSIKLEDLAIDLSMNRVMADYPASCFPDKLKRRTNKAKQSLFEQIDDKLYEPAAKMIAFHTDRNRLHAWIKAFEILYFNNIGNRENEVVNWSDDPPKWNDSNSANSIIIEYSSKNPDLANPLFFKITFYVTTGTIQVQGNHKDIFVNEHFDVLKKLVQMILAENQDCQIMSLDHEETTPKTIYDSEEENDSQNLKDKHEEKSVIVSKKADTTSVEDADRFDKCLSRMEHSFVKAIQELSKTQNDMFAKTMKLINTEISNTVTSQFKPMGELISKSLASNLQPVKDDISKSLRKQIEPIGEEISQSIIKKIQPVLDGKDKIDSLKSEHSAKISALQDSFQNRLDNQADKHKAQLKETEIRHKLEIDKLKDEHDIETRDYKQKLEKCDEEILSLKMHASRASDLDDGSVEIVAQSSARRNSAASVSSRNMNLDPKPRVFLIGTSNIKNIREDKLSQATHVKKYISYTLNETRSLLSRIEREPEPAEVVLHILTNDIKNFSPEDCVDSLHKIVTECKSKWPAVKIVISLETPRADSTDLNTKVILVNSLIIQKFINDSDIHLCNNSNLANNGEPIRSLLENDLYHLSAQGTSRLAANLKRIIHESLNIETARQPGGGSSSKNFPPFYRSFPFFPPGYYLNNRRGRGRGKRGSHF